MNPDLVRTKLESLSRCLDRMRFAVPTDLGLFLGDFNAQDIAMKNLERAVQVCVDIANHLVADRQLPPPPSMGGAFEALARESLIPSDLATALRKTVGLRNLAVNEYESVDYTRVHGFVLRELGVFEGFARAILQRL